MALAAIIGLYLFSLGTAPRVQGSAPAPAAQAAPQSDSAPPPKPPVQAKPQHHRKKAVPPNCTNSPTPLNPAIGNSEPAKAAADASTEVASHSPSSGQSDAMDAAAKSSGLTNSAPATPASATLPPCPPAKKVVRNGGSSEPAIQLVGGTNAEQAAHQRSTDELTSATEENLKKAAGRQLSASQEEMVGQIRQFLQQSKTAVDTGDLERGQNLAQKAHLLSEELVKP